MNEERAKLFAELLEEVVSIDGGFVPKIAWYALHKLVPLPAVEVLITRKGGEEFLLVYRKDEHWDGWHIPGGFIRGNESIEDACYRIAKDEVGGQVAGLKLISVSRWKEHAYGGHPISFVMVGYLVGEIEETEEIKFFDRIPSHMIARKHSEFLATYLDFVKQRAVISMACS